MERQVSTGDYRGYWGQVITLVIGLGGLIVYLRQLQLPGREATVSFAALAILWGLLLNPSDIHQRLASTLRCFLWPLLPALATLVASWFFMGNTVLAEPTVELTIGVFLLSLLLTSLPNYLYTRLGNQRTAALLVLIPVTLVAGTPIWLAPLTLYLDLGEISTNLMVWTNPLAYLSNLAEYDILRQEWLYAHSPLGGERFSYPAPLFVSAIYLALTAAATLLWRRKKLEAHVSGRSSYPSQGATI
jgi:hypothetical protein